jgi:peptidyl-prolyl cis-trans isomerase C
VNPRRRRTRLLVAPVLLVALALGAAGCDSVRPAALEVNGHEYSESSVNDELQAIADNPQLGDQATSGAGTLNSQLTAAWLQTLVEEQVVDQQLQRRDLRVTNADRARGEEAAARFLGDASVLAGFPKWLRDEVIDRFAAREVLFAELGEPVTDEAVQAAYEQFVEQQQASCPSGRFVAHILVDTEAEAAALKAQLDAGADFTELARDNSTDTASAANGGELGCVDGQQFVPEFQDVATNAPLNQVSAPVQTEFGYHLIVVRDAIPFAAVEDAARAQLESETSGAEDALARLTAKADVTVQPRYGRWVVRDGAGSVQPPARPAGSEPSVITP